MTLRKTRPSWLGDGHGARRIDGRQAMLWEGAPPNAQQLLDGWADYTEKLGLDVFVSWNYTDEAIKQRRLNSDYALCRDIERFLGSIGYKGSHLLVLEDYCHRGVAHGHGLLHPDGLNPTMMWQAWHDSERGMLKSGPADRGARIYVARYVVRDDGRYGERVINKMSACGVR